MRRDDRRVGIPERLRVRGLSDHRRQRRGTEAGFDLLRPQRPEVLAVGSGEHELLVRESTDAAHGRAEQRRNCGRLQRHVRAGLSRLRHDPPGRHRRASQRRSDRLRPACCFAIPQRPPPRTCRMHCISLWLRETRGSALRPMGRSASATEDSKKVLHRVHDEDGGRIAVAPCSLLVLDRT